MKEAERQGLGHINRFGGWVGGFVEGREHKQLLVSAPKLQKIGVHVPRDTLQHPTPSANFYTAARFSLPFIKPVSIEA